MNNSLIEDRQIRVFISSTFQDMQDEREYLIRHTFPVLRQKAALRDVSLTELDLRWGITPEEAESGLVVEICLREIENSIPFFVGIIGNRYGWIPEQKDLDARVTERFAVVNDYLREKISVTEMEMQFGVLKRDTDMHAYFFIKDQAGQQVEEDHPEMLRRLKEAVHKSKYPDTTYSSPENLGIQVEEAFSQLLDQLFPEEKLSMAEKVMLQQRAFRNGLCRSYIRNEHNFRVIDDWLEQNDCQQLVVTGASGLGKSALIANWLREQEQKVEQSYRIVYHFVGNGSSESLYEQITASLVEQIEAAYGFGSSPANDAVCDFKAKSATLDDLFFKVASAGDKPLLLVLDAINQIKNENQAKQLNWLPVPPQNVRILCTTLEEDETMQVCLRRHFQTFCLLPLDLVHRRLLVESYLCSYGKKLKPEQVMRIITDPQCENTLVLKTLLDELINFGVFEQLDQRIDFYLRAESIEEFYQMLLESYELLFPFTRHILSLLALSQKGMSEEEILKAAGLKPLQWSQFYCSFIRHLMVKNGLITFSHSYVRMAVVTRYALDEMSETTIAMREEIISLFVNQPLSRAWHELAYQYYVLKDEDCLYDVVKYIQVFCDLYETDRAALIRYWNRLRATYGMEKYDIRAMWINDDSERYYAYRCLASFTRNDVVDLELSLHFSSQMLQYASTLEDKADVLNTIGGIESKLGYHKVALQYFQQSLEIKQEIYGENHPGTAVSIYNLGNVYRTLGVREKALEYQLKALALFESALGRNDQVIARTFNTIGLTYGELGEYQKELEYQLKALEIDDSIYGKSHTNTSLSFNNVGLAYRHLGDYQRGLEFHLKALEIDKSYYGEIHPQTSVDLNNIGCAYGELEEHEKALEYQLKALDVRTTLYGEIHTDTATAINNVGVTYGNLGDHEKALEYQLKALDIYESVYGDRHPSVAALYSNVGGAYLGLGDYDKAIEYIQHALDIYNAIEDDEAVVRLLNYMAIVNDLAGNTAQA